ncbi:arylsulfatase [Mariniphaga sediminis]|uniref:Arylsulfatase n=1 Tax=Mariniphaga sediminis TaxID=1628158 RepID=A0A399CZK0_9BACT|nr:sulfatase-like hydrolase/transferase [Mariniphaga sediminis]RIH64358.1 arylsulfatase [Mariniphaga sediminis]
MKILHRNLLSLSIVGLLTFSAAGNVKDSRQQKLPLQPNILIIIPDDLGWSDVGYHGSVVKTPHIDKLAATGIRLEQHYVMPTCTPTRVSLMTGKYPSRYGIVAPDYGEVIDLGDPTLASVLKENGYFTAIAGKWHMGSPPYTPLKYGFQSSYGYFDGQIDPYTHEYKTETKLTERRSWHRNDEYLDEEGHVTDLLTDEALRIIEAENDKPFFLYLAHHVPHYPLDEPDEWMSLYDGLSLHPSRKLFAASVSHMDAGIGKIMEALERTGKRENTLILFLSDNGGQHSWHSNTEYRGKYADNPHSVLGNNYPLRGWKGDLYEGGIRVPAIASWPGKLQPGEANFPIHMSDWLPTLCHLIGAEKVLKDWNPDGKNIWPFLTGVQDLAQERSIYWKTGQTYAVREGNWKLLVDRNSGQTGLFNLENDFRETRDLAESYPEKVKSLLELLEKFKAGDE